MLGSRRSQGLSEGFGLLRKGSIHRSCEILDGLGGDFPFADTDSLDARNQLGNFICRSSRRVGLKTLTNPNHPGISTARAIGTLIADSIQEIRTSVCVVLILEKIERLEK